MCIFKVPCTIRIAFQWSLLAVTSVEDGLRKVGLENRTLETEESLYWFLQRDPIKRVYLCSHKNPEIISPG